MSLPPAKEDISHWDKNVSKPNRIKANDYQGQGNSDKCHYDPQIFGEKPLGISHMHIHTIKANKDMSYYKKTDTITL